MSDRVLVVDDEAGVRSSLTAILTDDGYTVEAVESGEAALELLAVRRFDLVLLDVWLPGRDGLETLDRLRELAPELPVVMISGHGSIETAVKAVQRGARDFVEKPLSLEKTLLAVGNALQRVRLEGEVRALKAQLDQRYVMVGDSPAMQRLRAEIAQAAPSNGRALIFGENGTGKELVARAIHGQSRRAQGPFVEVNCAAIPEELIESELFGHARGAFTGALSSRKGKFELAHGGTLFLDEIGDMSLKTQAKVLRALQEQRIEPVGGTGSVEVDARVIAATNKDLASEIRRGTFREDLYFRLNVIPFHVPPLRERLEDVPALARHFMESLAAEHGRRPKAFAPEALDVLARLPWPGNVRELRNIVERVVIMTPGDRVEVRHLPASLLESLPPRPLAGAPDSVSPTEEPSLASARDDFERQYILQRYRECGGNMSRTAAALGVERSNLYRKMKAFGLLPPRREDLEPGGGRPR
jgi:two-component system nitrogen regulation response regulator NtrX